MRIELPLLLACAVLLSACRKDEPERPADTPSNVGNSGGVYIVNEGNFQWGNASVSHYDKASGTVVEDLFAPANGGGLGDVAQSMTLFNGKAYLVINNSHKVVVVDPQTFVATATITGFGAPRYLLPVSNAKAYVTDLNTTGITVVDLATNTISGSIPCHSATGELVLAYGKAYVTAPGRDQLYVIDTATDQLTDSIAISAGGDYIRQDAHGKLWVLCGGYMSNGAAPALHRIDPLTRTVEASFTFPSSSSPWRLSTNAANDTLYFLDDHVFRMSIHDTAVPTAPFITASGRNFYALGIDPADGTVYVGDAIDYVQRGVVYRYAPNGAERGNFHVGIIPNGFCFN